MSTIIGADAANKLAGLQIDTLSKYRAGQLTLDQWERFNNLSLDDREARFGDWKKPEPVLPAEPTEKFSLFVDLGIITIPTDYDHATRLTSFRKKNRKKFYDYNDDITDEHFPTPSRILKPREKLQVKVFKQCVSGHTTPKERVAFLKSQNTIFTGAQGASLVFEYMRTQLPKGYWYVSFDEKDALWFGGGNHRVPYVRRASDGDFKFYLGSFEDGWGSDDCLLSFCEVK